MFLRVGDLVMMTPLLRQLARGADLVLIARPWACELFRDQRWIAEIHGLRRPRKGLRALSDQFQRDSQRRLIRKLDGRIDEVVTFAAERQAVKRMLRRIAPGGVGGDSGMRELALPFAGEGHVIDRIAAALFGAGFGLAGFDPTPRLDVPAAHLAAAREDLARLGRRVLAVQAGSSLTDRTWWRRRQPNLKGLDPTQWAELLTLILVRDEADAIVFHGSAPEHNLAAEIIALVPPELRPRLHNRAGAVPLADLASQLQAARALISVDTGPAHIAAAVGCPLLSIFGPTDPDQYLSRGPGPVEFILGSAPCQFCHNTHAWTTCRANICLTHLPIEALDAAWRRLNAKLAP